MKDKSYTVYKHTSPSNKCYIGITCLSLITRWGSNGWKYLRKNKNGRFIQPKFANAILKYGWDNMKHEILYTNLTIEEAKTREIELIKYYKDLNLSYNITDGGDLNRGMTFTPEERKRRSELAKKINIGRHLSEEAKDRIRQARKGKPSPISKEKWIELSAKISAARKGKPHPHKGNISENTRKALIEAIRKPVLQYTLDGIFIKEFPSIVEAALEVGAFAGNISSVCKGKKRSCKGFIWKYKQNEQENI